MKGNAEMNILVIEDEPKAAECLRQVLTGAGHTVEVALNGTDGLRAAVEGNHTLAILDVMLPGSDGFAVLSALLAAKRIPILVLTAGAQNDDRVREFDLRADNYVAKPFQNSDLLAAVRALLKGCQTSTLVSRLHVWDLDLDAVSHRATRAGQCIDLSAKEFALLFVLGQRAGQVLSRTQIASLVWGIHFDVDTNVVEVAIRRLRAKIDNPFEQKLIHTVRGVGYVLELRGDSREPDNRIFDSGRASCPGLNANLLHT